MAGIKIKVGADASQFEKAMNGVKSRLTGLNVMVGGMMAFKALSASIAAVGNAAGTAARGMMSLIKAGEEAKTEEARLRNVVKQMGIYGNAADSVTDRLIEQADAMELLTGVDGESITVAQSKLATFKAVGKTAHQMGGIFDQVMQASIDLAANGFGTLESNAELLGRALQNPERGLRTLRTQGRLTPEEFERISNAFKETGDSSKMMADVMAVIGGRVKGAAAATADSTVRLGKAFDQLREEIGKPISDQFDRLAKNLLDQIPAMRDAAERLGRAVANTISSTIEGDYTNLKQIGEFIGKTLSEGLKIGIEKGMHGTKNIILKGMDVGLEKVTEKVIPGGEMLPDVSIEKTLTSKGLEPIARFSDLFLKYAPKLPGQQFLPEDSMQRLQRFMSGGNDKMQVQEFTNAVTTGAQALVKQLEYDPNWRMTTPNGREFRQAAPGESTSLRDSTGLRIMETLESIERNTSPAPFPAR